MNNLVTSDQAKLEYELFNIKCRDQNSIDDLQQNFERTMVEFALNKLNRGKNPFTHEQYKDFTNKLFYIYNSHSKEFIMDCVVYSLFSTQEYQYDLNWTYALNWLPLIKKRNNPLFWASQKLIKDLAYENNVDLFSLHFRDDEESFVYLWMEQRVKDFSNEAWDTYNSAKYVLADTFPLRKKLIKEMSDAPFSYWNADWGAICALMSHNEKNPESYEKFFRTAYFNLEEKLKGYLHN